MKLFNFGKGRQHTVVGSPLPPETKRLIKAVGFRHGMWVIYRGRVGIVTGAAETLDGAIKVMLTDDKLGLNQEEVMVPFTELRQAKHREIPEARRPSDVHHAARMGYGQ